MVLTPEKLAFLKAAMVQMLNDADVQGIVESKEQVYERFSGAFSLQEIGALPESEMRAFLDFKVNKHWSNLHRASGPIFENFPETKEKLAQLIDPNSSPSVRWGSISDLKGMGHGIASAILHVSSPESLGVWNSTSEGALKNLGMFPEFPRGATLGDRYSRINDVLNELKSQLQTDLWVLDALFWYLGQKKLFSGLPKQADERPKFDGREKSIKGIVHTVNDTVKRANGQIVGRKVKEKELRMNSYQLEHIVRELVEASRDCCAITGLPFEYEGDGENTAMRPSLDRIDSSGHYEAGNVQLVCRFINFWKMATDDGEFRILLQHCIDAAPNLRK